MVHDIPTQPFSIKITRHGWLEGSDPSADLCSHGGFRIRVGTVLLTNGDEDFGVSESCLGLLRTLREPRDLAVAPYGPLIMHGCGTILMMSCPIGVDWSVLHEDDSVLLDDFTHKDSPGAGGGVDLPSGPIRVSTEHYCSEIVRVALEAKTLFVGAEKTFDSKFERAEYVAFWREYDSLLSQFCGT